jgi:predicted amidohydrolase
MRWIVGKDPGRSLCRGAPHAVDQRRTLETGIPMVVVNRGGKEPELDFSKGESAVSRDGERLFSFTAPTGGIFYVDWDRRQRFREVPR